MPHSCALWIRYATSNGIPVQWPDAVDGLVLALERQQAGHPTTAPATGGSANAPGGTIHRQQQPLGGRHGPRPDRAVTRE